MHGLRTHSLVDSIERDHQAIVTFIIASSEEGALDLLECQFAENHASLLVVVSRAPEVSSQLESVCQDHWCDIGRGLEFAAP